MQQWDWRGGRNISHCSRAFLSPVGVHPDRLPAPEQWLTPSALHPLHLHYTTQSLSLHLGSAPREHGAEHHHRSPRSTSSSGKSNLLPPTHHHHHQPAPQLALTSDSQLKGTWEKYRRHRSGKTFPAYNSNEKLHRVTSVTSTYLHGCSSWAFKHTRLHGCRDHTFPLLLLLSGLEHTRSSGQGEAWRVLLMCYSSEKLNQSLGVGAGFSAASLCRWTNTYGTLSVLVNQANPCSCFIVSLGRNLLTFHIFNGGWWIPFYVSLFYVSRSGAWSKRSYASIFFYSFAAWVLP